MCQNNCKNCNKQPVKKTLSVIVEVKTVDSCCDPECYYFDNGDSGPGCMCNLFDAPLYALVYDESKGEDDQEFARCEDCLEKAYKPISAKKLDSIPKHWM